MNALANEVVGPAAQQQAPGVLAPPQVPEPLNIVVQGQAPAVGLPPVEPNQPPLPAQQWVIDNYTALPEMGLGLYEAQDLTTVVFDANVLSEDAVAKADAAGALPQLLAAAQQPQQAPGGVLAAEAAAQRPQQQVQSAPAAPALPAPKVPAATQNLLARARVRTMGAGPKPAGLAPSPVGQQVSQRPV